VLPFESSPPGPLSTSWRGGTCLQHPAELNNAFLRGPSLSTQWRGTEGEASEGRTPQRARRRGKKRGALLALLFGRDERRICLPAIRRLPYSYALVNMNSPSS